jgi:hypothetical protein
MRCLVPEVMSPFGTVTNGFTAQLAADGTAATPFRFLMWQLEQRSGFFIQRTGNLAPAGEHEKY